MKRTEIAALNRDYEKLGGETVTIAGWIKFSRDSKAVAFFSLSDRSCFTPVQVVLDEKLPNFKEATKFGVGASVKVVGEVVVTPGAKQPYEVHAQSVELLGAVAADYPLQKKRHTLEYLRTISYLRPRTNTFQAVFRIRSAIAYAIHTFFQERGFVYVHTPLVTASDCEGAGEMFRVTTIDPENPPRTEDGKVDYSQDFFGRQPNLTVSGQMEAEAMALAFGNVYTFGPTFRAEPSFTTRHAAEFWMIEPEMAFADLRDDMECIHDMLKFVIGYVLENCPDELAFCNSFYDKGLIERLKALMDAEFGHVTYTEAIELLEKVKDRFKYPVYWGCDLQTEHERYLTEEVFQKPVFVTDYPKEIKAFYMRLNDDGKTVAAVDLLVPGIGEIVGGSQREERADYLEKAIESFGLNKEDYGWYLNLRRYGGVEHAGFGLGFERLVMYMTGIENIRDVLPFPRTTGSIY